MRAAVCHAYGPPQSVSVEEWPDPVAGPGQVVVSVRAAAVNFPDVLVVGDRYQVSVPTPFVPGSEFAGVVDEVGPGVDAGLLPGDRVRGAGLVGAFAERVSVGAGALAKLDPSVSFAEGAAFGVAHATAYHSLRSVARVEPGEWVAVLGAAGGVGLATLEVARLLGARVVAAASSAQKLEVCRQRGAEATVDYSREDLKSALRSVTGGGPDVVVDPVGGEMTEPALRATRYGGRFVVVGFASGDIPRLALNLVLLKGVVVMGFEMASFMTNRVEEAERDTDELDRLLSTGQLRPHVSELLPLDRVGEALELVAGRRAVGKVVVDMGG